MKFPARLITALFVATTFTGSALLFVVQPMFARMILPKLGGSAAVWNTCVLFFQTMLLWAEPQPSFAKEASALATGIADQLAIAISKARLSAEVIRLRRELENAQYTEHNGGTFVGLINPAEGNRARIGSLYGPPPAVSDLPEQAFASERENAHAP